MFSERFEKLIDLYRTEPQQDPPTTIGAFYGYFLRQVWPSFLALLIVGLAGALIEVALFSYLSSIIDLVNHSRAETFFADHWPVLLWMAVVALIIRPIIIALNDLLVHQTINPGLSGLVQWQNHRHVLRQSLHFFQNDFAGRIAQRITQTSNALCDSAVQLVDALWHVIIYIVSAFVLFVAIDWKLILPLLIWMVIYSSALIYFVPRVKQRSIEASDARSKLMGVIVDGYTNITTLKLFAHNALEQEYARQAVEEKTVTARRAGRMITAMDVTLSTLNGILIVATTGLSLLLWRQSLISVGAIALTTTLIIRLVNMSGWIMWVVNGIFSNIGQVQDGMKSITRPLTVQDQPDAADLHVRQGKIDFNQISFGYHAQRRIIHGLDLHIKAGEKVGLIGASGAGKSSLVNLLLRMYDLEQGEICIDDQNIATVTQESLRQQIGMITQDTSLLHRSIRDNLLYGKPDASEQALQQAIINAKADEFISQLSDSEGRCGLDAMVGERGVKLSGGQRQRIAIARVLLKNAPILIMDEATSALDSEVEAAIQESLETLMTGKTVIAIAHRLSTIARMDRLIVMADGNVVESGTHRQLLEQQGVYARLWQRQTGGFVAAE